MIHVSISRVYFRRARSHQPRPTQLDKKPSRLILPILFDLEAPFPLEVDVLVVVREEAVDRVGAARHQPGRRVLGRRGVRLDLRLGRVRTDHMRHLVH